MVNALPELRVEIRKLGSEFFAVTKQAQGREVCTNRFQHNPTGLTHLGPLWLLERGALLPIDGGSRGMRRLGKVNERQVALYGMQLYRYLFGDGTQLETFLHNNPSYAHQTHMTLALHPEAASLRRLPWEYLYDGEKFLCLEGNFLLNRVPEGLEGMHFQSFPFPLRMLAIIAGPSDLEALDIDREMAVLQEPLDDAIRTGLIELDVLATPTVSALSSTLQSAQFHLLHFIGHGVYSRKQQRGFLCFEDEMGNSNALSAAQLGPVLARAKGLRLVVLSACHSAQIGVLDAFDNVATSLLYDDIPAVLVVPSSLQDESAIELARSFYGGVAQGQMLGEALARVRKDLWELDRARKADQQRFDWGVPALYLRSPNIFLTDPQATPAPTPPSFAIDAERSRRGLPVPHKFVGRQESLQQLADGVRRRIPNVYVQGPAGIGKSALIAKFIERSRIAFEGIHVVHCRALLHPLDAMWELAEFWRAQGHGAAADYLLDTQRDPLHRAQRALEMTENSRFLIVFDDLDAWLAPDDEQASSSQVADAKMRAILKGFLNAASHRTMFVFNGCRPWSAFEALTRQQGLTLTLSQLSLWPAILLMNALSNLSQESLSDKRRVYARLGGFPYTMALADAWMGKGGRLLELLQDLDGAHLPGSLNDDLLDRVLAYFSPNDLEVLTLLAVTRRPFSAEIIEYLLKISTDQARDLLKDWHACALIRFYSSVRGKASWYVMPALVQNYLLKRIEIDQRPLLHARIAEYYGAPFVKEARQRLSERSSAPLEDAQVGWFARSGSGILGMWIRQAPASRPAHRSLDRALAWQHHLFYAGELDASSDIIEAVQSALNRMRCGDLSKALLRRNIDASIDASTEERRARLLVNLAKLLLSEGNVTSALRNYDDAYKLFRSLGDKRAMAKVLGRMGSAYQRNEEYVRAIQMYEVSLALQREIADDVAELQSYRQLATLYRLKGDGKRALVYNRDAQKLDSQRDDSRGLVMDTIQQGRILSDMGQRSKAYHTLRKSRDMAKRMEDQELLADSLIEIGLLLTSWKAQDALRFLAEGLAIHTQLGSPKVAHDLEVFGFAYEQQGDLPRAIEKFEQAQKIYATTAPSEVKRLGSHIKRLRGRLSRGRTT